MVCICALGLQPFSSRQAPETHMRQTNKQGPKNSNFKNRIPSSKTEATDGGFPDFV